MTMTSPRARVALIGVGHWHTTMHLQGLRAASARIVSVSDAHDRRAAERWSQELDCPAFDSAEAQLSEGGVDVVWAMPRHADAPALATELITRGIPFAIEKPMGVHSQQLEPLLELAEPGQVFAAVALVNRYSPLWDELDRLRTDNCLHTALHGHFRVINGAPVRYVKEGVPWMLQRTVSGGGALRNLGIHGADSICRLAGDHALTVLGAATTSRLYQGDIEDYATALIGSDDGGVFGLEAGYTHGNLEASDQEFRIAGDGAYLRERPSEMTVSTHTGDRVVPGVPVADRYVRFAVDTLSRLRDGRPPIATLDDCWRAMHLIDQIYQHAEYGRHAEREGDEV